MPEEATGRQMIRVLDILADTYPEARCALHFDGPWQLLVATILSAQCTDRQVNLVTGPLFQRFPDPDAMAGAAQGEVETLIRSTGFFRNKAANLIACAATLLERHAGRVPEGMDALVALPGVGRKTANVVLGNAFAVPGLAVDTHVRRVSRRLGWTTHTDPVRIEQDLCARLPAERWTMASHLLIHHGRQICRASRPACHACPVLALCARMGVA
jgi:endonuclease III